MERLNPKEKELVALGAALGCNCIPCVVYHLGVAEKIGIPAEQIREAVELANKIRGVPAAQVLKTAYAHIGKTPEKSPEGPANPVRQVAGANVRN
jgi:AhpD family alkylhydroperoxidase